MSLLSDVQEITICAPNLLHVLVSRILACHNLCSPDRLLLVRIFPDGVLYYFLHCFISDMAQLSHNCCKLLNGDVAILVLVKERERLLIFLGLGLVLSRLLLLK